MRARLSSAGKLTGISDQWKDGLRQDTIDERIGFGAATLEFSARVAGGIDLAAQLRFQRKQQFQYLGERQVLADQQHVDVALRRVGLFCEGTIDPCGLQIGGEGRLA